MVLHVQDVPLASGTGLASSLCACAGVGGWGVVGCGQNGTGVLRVGATITAQPSLGCWHPAVPRPDVVAALLFLGEGSAFAVVLPLTTVVVFNLYI